MHLRKPNNVFRNSPQFGISWPSLPRCDARRLDSRKTPPSFFTPLRNGVFVTHKWHAKSCSSDCLVPPQHSRARNRSSQNGTTEKRGSRFFSLPTGFPAKLGVSQRVGLETAQIVRDSLNYDRSQRAIYCASESGRNRSEQPLTRQSIYRGRVENTPVQQHFQTAPA